MATHDYVIANGTGAAVRSDLNGALAAIVSNNSSASEPAPTYAYMWWPDTTTGLLKQRNAANSAWITIGTLASTNLGLATLASPTFTGTVTIPAGASISGYAPLASPTFTGTVTIPAGASISGYLTAATAATTYAPIANGVPAGAINYFAMSAAPTGYLKANGATISRTTYSVLFAAIGTTFGAGDGSTTFALPDLRGEFIRGWDDARGVDSGRSFGTTQGQDYQSHNHGVNDPSHRHDVYYDINQGSEPNSSYAFNGVSQFANRASSFSFTGISIQNNGGAETRPRNIALLACIKF